MKEQGVVPGQKDEPTEERKNAERNGEGAMQARQAKTAGAQQHKAPEMGPKGDTQAIRAEQQETLEEFKKAAEKGDADALFWMGRCYEKGQGVVASKSEALKYYQKCAACPAQGKSGVYLVGCVVV